MKINGLDELQKQLKKMESAANELDGTHQIPLPELLTDSFLRKHTNFSTIDEFEAQPIFEKYPTFEEIPDQEMDQFVSETSSFSSWDEMLQEAASAYALRKLGF